MEKLTTQELAVAMHAHLCSLQAQVEALEIVFLSRCPEEQVQPLRKLLADVRSQRLEKHVLDLDRSTPGLAAAVGEQLEQWQQAPWLHRPSSDS